MRHNRSKDPPKSDAVNAAALQDHLLRSLGFPQIGLNPQSLKSKPKPLASFGRKIVNTYMKPIKNKEENSEIQEIRQRAAKFQNKLTLAQRLGLIDKPAPPLNEEQ